MSLTRRAALSVAVNEGGRKVPSRNRRTVRVNTLRLRTPGKTATHGRELASYIAQQLSSDATTVPVDATDRDTMRVRIKEGRTPERTADRIVREICRQLVGERDD